MIEISFYDEDEDYRSFKYEVSGYKDVIGSLEALTILISKLTIEEKFGFKEYTIECPKIS